MNGWFLNYIDLVFWLVFIIALTKPVAVKKKVADTPVKPPKAKPAPAKPQPEKFINNDRKSVKLDDNSLIKLLKAMAIRAKFGGEAEVTYNKVVELLKK